MKPRSAALKKPSLSTTLSIITQSHHRTCNAKLFVMVLVIYKIVDIFKDSYLFPKRGIFYISRHVPVDVREAVSAIACQILRRGAWKQGSKP